MIIIHVCTVIMIITKSGIIIILLISIVVIWPCHAHCAMHAIAHVHCTAS